MCCLRNNDKNGGDPCMFNKAALFFFLTPFTLCLGDFADVGVGTMEAS